VLEKDYLRLLNSPTLPPEALATVFNDPESWPPLQHESMYSPADYRQTWLRRSHLVSLVADVIERNRWTYAPSSVFWPDDDTLLFADGPPRQLLLKLLETFATEVAQRGGHFLILYLPEFTEIQSRLENRAPDSHYTSFWGILKASFSVIDPTDLLTTAATEPRPVKALFTPKLHYSGLGAALLTKAIQRSLPADCTAMANRNIGGPEQAPSGGRGSMSRFVSFPR
jgi:hypothetical protein